MSKVKNAELEEAALHVAGKLLVEIETLVDNTDYKQHSEVENLKKLIKAFQQLKPYF